MRQRSKWAEWLRTLFLGGMALVILYDQVFIAATAQPVLIFLFLFLLGSIPALRGDGKSDRPSVFVRLVMAMMGVQLPDEFTEKDRRDGTKLYTDGQTPLHSASRAQRSGSSGKSSSASTKDSDDE